MKKYISSFLLIILCFTTCFAQDVNKKTFYGVKAGVNLSFMDVGKLDKEIFSPDIMVGFNIGFKTVYNFNKMLGLSGELMMSTQNYSTKMLAGYSVSGEKWMTDIRYYFTNLSVPIMLNITVAPKLVVELGAQYTFRFYAREVLDSDLHVLITYPHNNYQEFNSKTYNKSDVSAIVGLCFKITNNIALNLRYSHGFIPAIETIKVNLGVPSNASNVVEPIDREFNSTLKSLHLCFEYNF